MGDLFDDFVPSSAVISPCGRYRYALTRQWDAGDDRVMFVMLNPSTADASRDDPTIRRCIAYAKRWGFSGLSVGNLFAFRATDPAAMKRADDPIGPENDEWLMRLAEGSSLVVAAWGNHGSFMGRGGVVRRMIPRLHALKVGGTGEPCHPLYLRSDLKPFPLAGA